MRIGICGYPTQSPNTSTRGIGRYATGFIKSLIHTSSSDEFVVYLRGSPGECVAIDPFLASHQNATVRWYQEDASDRAGSLDVVLDNRDRLDWLILTSPHESHVSSKGKIPRVATIVYDMIPALFPEVFLDAPGMETYRRSWQAYIDAARSYDKLLSISSSTCADFAGIGRFPRDRIALVGCGVDRRFVPRPKDWQYPNWLREAVQEKPYVLHVGGMDPRKGGENLMLAWRNLPQRIRTSHKLIYAYEVDGTYSFRMRQLASLNGLNFQFEMLGYVTDERLVDLYQNARVMCLPSRAEGLGLPILESLACGTPVVAGNNTGQIEAVGPGGFLVEPGSVSSISGVLENILDSVDLRERLGRLGIEHASNFTWEGVAERTRRALAPEAPPGLKAARRKAPGEPMPDHDIRPPLAFFGPISPTPSGVTPIGMTLARALSRYYKVTFYHDPEVRPKARDDWASAIAAVRPADAYDGCPRIVHQFGNSHHHAWQLPLIQRRGGVVTLHDVYLGGLRSWLVKNRGMSDSGNWKHLYDSMDPGRTAFVLHSEAARKLFLLNSGHFHGVVIPPPVDLNVRSPEQRRATREKLGFPTEGEGDLVVLGCGGIVHETKLPQVVLAAYRLARSRCERDGVQLVLAMIGEEGDGGVTRKACEGWGIPHVTWTGKLDPGEFADAMACCDMAIQLREGPTNGETSGALLDAMRGGTPAIVSDVGSFAEIDGGAVLKVAPDIFQVSDVAGAIVRLATDRLARVAMANNAMRLVEWQNDPARVAKEYLASIEALFSRDKSQPLTY